MGAVIDVSRVVIKISRAWIGELVDQFALQLILDKVAQFQTVRRPLIDNRLGSGEPLHAGLDAFLKRAPVHAALISLKPLVALIMRISIEQQRVAYFIQQLDTRHL